MTTNEVEKIEFTAKFTLELTPAEGQAIYAFLQNAPARFSRTVLNKLDAVAQTQSALAGMKSTS